MDTQRGLVALVANNDVIEVRALGRVYWTTRGQFEGLEKLSMLLESAIAQGADLSTIRHIFDEPRTADEIHHRYRAWLGEGGETSTSPFPRKATTRPRGRTGGR